MLFQRDKNTKSMQIAQKYLPLQLEKQKYEVFRGIQTNCTQLDYDGQR